MTFLFCQFFRNIFAFFVTCAKISSKSKMLVRIFETFSSKILITLLNIINFSLKKNRFNMKKTSLIDYFKRNVKYFVQKKFLIYKNFNEIKFVTFDDHVRDYFDIDVELQTFRHRQSRFIIIFATLFKSKFSTISSFVALKIVIIASILVVTSIVVVVIDNLINLNFAMTIVQDKSLKTSKVKDICNK